MVFEIKNVVIVSAARTPVGTMGGSLKNIHPADLGAYVIKEALKKGEVKTSLVDEVIMGCVGQAAENAFIARMCALKAGLPTCSSALTVNRLCGSGLEAINNAAQQIRTTQSEIVVAGGTENMDQIPFYIRKARYGYRMGHSEFEDGLVTALTDPFGDYHMGITAENVAARFNIERETQDAFALESQYKANNAIEKGYFKDQIVPIKIKDEKGNTKILNVDEHPRKEMDLKKLSNLRPIFKKEGTVTAGNSSGINNGAAALVLMSEDKANELGITPLAYVCEQIVTGINPEIMGYAPTLAINELLEKSNTSLDEIDLIELNEAFAAQSVAVIKALGIESDKVNVNGGAIALGHPIGASGAIITVKLLYELKRRRLKKGVSALCIGGGQGIATLFEMAD